VMNPDGSGQARVTKLLSMGCQSPCWSPDSSRIAWDSARGGPYDIYTMKADGSLQARLTDYKYGTIFHTAWSPFPP
jgi:Tol biopolymer transport system component